MTAVSYPEGPSLTVLYHPEDPRIQLHGAVELGQVVKVTLKQLGEYVSINKQISQKRVSKEICQ